MGTKRMWEILEKITLGKGTPDDIKRLEELAQRVNKGSLCGLGSTAPNPILSTLRYFRHEYDAHVERGECPAKRCKALIKYEITPKCIGCHLCFKVCPVKAVSGEPKKPHVIDQAKCIKCGNCHAACKVKAIDVLTGKGVK